MADNRNGAARFAFIGLIIAALGCLATGLLALLQAAVAIKVYTPQTPETVLQWIGIAAAVMLLGLAVYAILNPAGVRRFLGGRQARYGSNAFVLAVAMLGILIAVNILVFQNPVSKDLTEDKQHTLAPETVRALATLPERVTAIAFYTSQNPKDAAKQLLDNFKSNSKGKFDYRFVDPNADPVQAKQYNVTADGNVALVMGKASTTVSFADETEITRGLIRLISPQARTVYFLTGHGEPDVNGSGNEALSKARLALEGKNYTVKTLNLAAENKIPQDAKALIEAGPQNPMLAQEVALIKAYLDKGGALVLLEDPTPFTKFGDQPDPLADYIQSDWGISLDNDLIVDQQSPQPFYAISYTLSANSPITQRLTSNTVMPQARSLQVSKTPPSGVQATPLISTAPNSWGETDLAALQQNPPRLAFDQGKDLQGPLTLAASAQNSSTGGKVVVIGNVQFALDGAFSAYGNSDAFVNSVDWSAGEGNLINITPHTPITRTFNPPSPVQFLLLVLLTVIVVPGLFVIAGISSWLARRRRG